MKKQELSDMTLEEFNSPLTAIDLVLVKLIPTLICDPVIIENDHTFNKKVLDRCAEDVTKDDLSGITRGELHPSQEVILDICRKEYNSPSELFTIDVKAIQKGLDNIRMH